MQPLTATGSAWVVGGGRYPGKSCRSAGRPKRRIQLVRTLPSPSARRTAHSSRHPGDVALSRPRMSRAPRRAGGWRPPSPGRQLQRVGMQLRAQRCWCAWPLLASPDLRTAESVDTSGRPGASLRGAAWRARQRLCAARVRVWCVHVSVCVCVCTCVW